MVNSLLDDVNELLRLSCGDENRLQDIKRRLEDGLTVYNSDINYLKKLAEQQKDEIQDNAESKNNEPEPYEQYQPEPEPDPVLRVKSSGFSNDDKPILPKEQSETKKTAKTAGVIILSTLVFLVLVSLVMTPDTATTRTTPTVTNEQPKVTTPKVKSFSQMTDSELSANAVDWNYRDILRNIDGYSGKIIFVDGEVSFSYLNSGELHLCTSTENAKFGIPYTCANEDFVVMGNGVNTWVEKDILQGYVEVTGELDFMSNPKVKEIRLTCSNC